MALLNVLMAFNLLNGTYGLIIAAAAFVITFIFIVLLATKREIVYIDPDTDYEIAHDKFGWGRKVTLASANKTGKKFIGWSFDEDGEKRLGKKIIRLWKTTELYAVWEKPMVGISIDDANAAIEFVYVNDATGEELTKVVCPLSIQVPMEVNGESILGWGLDPSEGPLVTASDNDKSVLTVELYPVREGWDEVVEEEPVEEEPAEEEVIEEPAEEVAEEPAEEATPYAAVVEDEPAEEVIEEPVEEVAEEPAEEVVEEPAAEEVVVEPIIVPTYIDGNGNELDIRYSRSFTANVIQGEDNVKEFYSELKNHILSYKGVKSRISWKFDSYNRGRDQLVKLKIRGKTICMYIALDPNEFDKAKYHHDAVDAKIFEDVPMLVKIKSGLGLRKAKELVDILMAKLGIELDDKAKTVDYVAKHPYEETDALVQKGLIKILKADASDIKKAPAIVADEVAEEVVEEAPAEEVVEEAAQEVAEEAVEVAPVIVPTYVDGNGNELDIRYSRSFKANVIQADDTVKNYYSELKNHILSYKGVKSRTSWKFDSFNKGRTQLVKLKLRGKTLSMYCALDPNEFDKARYHHDETDSKMFEDVPMLVRIKSNLGLKKAKELVDILMAKLEIVTDAKFSAVDYVAENPYEDTPTLIGKGLIKVLQADENDVKVAPAIEEVVEEAPAEEVVEEAAQEAVEVAPVIVPTYVDGNGNELDIRYSRSFKANVIQADDTVKNYYSELKNHILSYKGVKSRTSWKFDSFNKGRTQLVKLKLRGKTLSMYCALDPNEFDKARYHHDETDSKMFEDVPMLVRIKSNLGLKKAKELVDILMAKLEIVTDAKFSAVDYVAENPYEDTPTLIGKGLIKVLQADENDVKVAPAIEEVVEEAPAEEVVEEVIEEVAEEVVEEIVEEAPAEEVIEEVAEEVVEEEPAIEEEVVEEAPIEEEPAEEVVEEVVEEAPAEEVIEEVIEEVAEEEPAIEEEVVEEEVAQEAAPATTVEEIQYVESVSADEVDDLVEDEVVDSLVEEDVEYVSADDTKKGVVNLDTLSKEFNDGDTVDLESLKAKGLVDKKTKSVKILARGTIDKALTIKAGEFSETALKMIVLTGGKAIKTVSKVK
ncbi:MAG: hypothetical protein E7622_03505 [Ruminococcaceae bacterium]|nr:hypothetical protein [Oscillospiraceae bacterium]